MRADILAIEVGYLRFPLGRRAVFAGLQVVGCDLYAGLTDHLNLDRSLLSDGQGPGIAETRTRGLSATAVEAGIGFPGIAAICTPTPLAAGGASGLTEAGPATGTAGAVSHGGAGRGGDPGGRCTTRGA